MPEKMASNSCFRYNFALVSRIANSFKDTSSFDLKPGQSIDIENARKEHESMVEALRRLSVDVIELPCDEKHPDGLFVDDIAVVINGTALICNPPSIDGKPSRQGEVSDLAVWSPVYFSMRNSATPGSAIYPSAKVMYQASPTAVDQAKNLPLYSNVFEC